MAPKDGPDIRTQRLVLRPVRESDDRGIFAMRSRLEIMKWSLKRVPDPSILDTQNHLRRVNEPYNLGFVVLEADACDSDSDRIIGSVGFNLSPPSSHVELGYMLHPSVWGKGYATEAVAAAMQAWWDDYAGVRTAGEAVTMVGTGTGTATDMAMPTTLTLWADTYPGNTPSHRVLEKCGFEMVKMMRDEDGEYELWKCERK